MHKVILINVATRSLSYHNVENRHDVYKLIGPECTGFECPIEFDNLDTMYADQDGLMHTIEGGFMMEGWSYAITGNVVIQGTNDEGESVDVKTTIEELAPQIIWTSKEAQERWRDKVL